MPFDLYLSYSGRRSYLLCPAKYEFIYILKDPTRSDPRSSLFGSIIGKVFEWFYTRRAWSTADPQATTLSYVEDATRLIFEKERFSSLADPAFCTSLRQDLFKFILDGIETIRSQKFLTPTSRAEANLEIEYRSAKHGMTLKLGGRPDFIHDYDGNIWLIDGKASKHREKYVDSEQLIWYATQHFLKYHVAPSRIGFLFWCFPEDPVKWVAYDNAAIRSSLDLTFETAKKIQLKKFDPTPSGECHRCDFQNKCEEGKKYLAKRKVESGGRIESSVFDLEMA